jgi:hypothetical protein
MHGDGPTLNATFRLSSEHRRGARAALHLWARRDELGGENRPGPALAAREIDITVDIDEEAVAAAASRACTSLSRPSVHRAIEYAAP